MFPDMNYFLIFNMGKVHGNFFLNKRCLDKIAGLIDVIQHNKIHCDLINTYVRKHDKNATNEFIC